MKLGIFIATLFLCSLCREKTNIVETLGLNPQTPKIEIQIEGKMNKGYLIGIEPYLTKKDYVTEDSFYQSMKAYASYAKKEEVIASDKTVVVLPENIGTWLIASGENPQIFEKKSMDEAMKELALNHIGRFVWVYLFEKSFATDAFKESIFRMKAWQMAETYQNVFSRLASEFRIDIIAGSIILPEPKVVEGKITITDGPLQNVSFYFHSDGTIDPKVTRKQNLNYEEKEFLKNNEVIENESYLTPLGVLHTMISTDSWYPDDYKNAKNSLADLVAIPSFVSPTDSWNRKWKGYYGQASPLDVNQKDINQLTELQAWRKYGVIGKANRFGINHAMNVFFNGELWDFSASGIAVILKNGKQIIVKRKKEKETGSIYAIGL